MSDTDFTNAYNTIPVDDIIDSTMVDNSTSTTKPISTDMLMTDEKPVLPPSDKPEIAYVNPIDTAYWKYVYNCERIYKSEPVLEQHEKMQSEHTTFEYECKLAIYDEFTKRMQLKTKLASVQKQITDAETFYSYYPSGKYTLTAFELDILVNQIKDINKKIEESTKKIEQITHKIEQYQIRIPYVCMT